MPKIIIKDGCLGVGESKFDFELMWDVSIPELHKQDDIRYEYSQWLSKDCTLYAWIWAISDIYNYEYSSQEIQGVVQESYNRGRQIGKGRYTQAGIRCAVDMWNDKYPDQKLLYFRMKIWDSTFLDALAKGYTIIVSYKGNSDYWKDYYDDAIVQWVDFPNPTYWHATTAVLIDGKIHIKDSYKGRTGEGGIDTNYYEIEHLTQLVENNVYYENCYFVIPEGIVDTTEQELKRLTAFKNEIDISMASHSAMWGITNEEYFKNTLHEWNNVLREKLLDIQLEMNKLT